MEEQKRYYWMRLRADFFEDDRIDYLEEQEHGAEFIVIYLKLALKSLKSDGMLYRNVGDSVVPYCYEKLSSLLRMPLQIVTDALRTLVTVGLIIVTDTGIIVFPQVKELTGSDVATDNAIRQRRYREKKKAEENAKKVEEFLSSVTNSNVTTVTKSNAVTLRNSNESKRKRKRLEIEIDMEKKNRISYGEYKNIPLTEEELNKFKAEYPKLWITYLNEMSGYLEANGKKYKNYLAALRNWAKRDYNKHSYVPAQTVEQTLDNLIV